LGGSFISPLYIPQNLVSILEKIKPGLWRCAGQSSPIVV
jgi:hypothetical protein